MTEEPITGVAPGATYDNSIDLFMDRATQRIHAICETPTQPLSDDDDDTVKRPVVEATA